MEKNILSKNSKSRTKSKSVKVGSIFILPFLLLYLPSLFNWVFGDNIKTGIIKTGAIEEAISVQAYIMRREFVIKSPFEGKCILNYGEGEKIAAGARIATIYKGESEKIVKDIEDIDEKILEVQKQDKQNDEIFSKDIKKVDQDIGTKVRNIADFINNRDIASVSDIKAGIDALIKKKAEITGDLSTSDTYIKQLKEKRDGFQKMLDSRKQDMYTSAAGIISYSIDGLEDILHPDMMSSITTGFLESLKPRTMNLDKQENIQANMPFAKIIDNLECIVVMPIDTDRIKGINVDDRISLRVIELGNKTIDGTVEYLSIEENKKGIIAVKVNEGIDETSKLRSLNVELIIKEIKGLKVPLVALKNIDRKKSTAQIMLVRHNYTKLKNVKLTGTDLENAIIDVPDEKDDDSAGLYDEYVLYAGNVEEGKVVRK